MQTLSKTRPEESTGSSFESQQSYRMTKMKFGKENFFLKVFTEDTIANAIKNLLTGKITVQMIFQYLL